jgi:hypothetical protein
VAVPAAAINGSYLVFELFEATPDMWTLLLLGQPRSVEAV